MALFLTESNSSTVVEKHISTFEVMNGLYEFATEAASLTETMLREDYAVHTQCAALTESGNVTESEEKKQGFVSKAWDVVKSIFVKLKDAVVKVAGWIKQLLQKLWAKIKQAFGATKDFVVKYSKLAYAKALIAVGAAKNVLANALISNQDEAAAKDALIRAEDALALAAEADSDAADQAASERVRVPVEVYDGIQNALNNMAAETVRQQAIGQTATQSQTGNVAKVQAASVQLTSSASIATKATEALANAVQLTAPPPEAENMKSSKLARVRKPKKTGGKDSRKNPADDEFDDYR